MINIKETAIEMYDAYCEAVGGKAWNGQPLPTGKEFFADPDKQLQANAWIAAAERAVYLLNRDNNNSNV